MSIGKMNVFIDIVEITATKDDEGFSMPKETVLASVRAYKETRHGSAKRQEVGATFTTTTTLFRFRAIPSLRITTAHAIRCEGEKYIISSVADIRGMYVEVFTNHTNPKGSNADGKSGNSDA